MEVWYNGVEDFGGITGLAEGLSKLRDSRFLPPMEVNCVEIVVKEAMARQFGRERVMTIGRAAILTQTHKGRAACHYCGPCHRGCITRSYFSSVNATLPVAEKTGRLTLRPYSVVHSLIFDSQTRRVSGVRVIDGQSHKSLEFQGRIIFLCASALESTRILLNSATPEFSSGLANSSGELGKNLMDHIMGGGADGIIPGFLDRVQFGKRPNGIYVPRFRNVSTKEKNFLRGYAYQGAAEREGWERGIHESGFGAGFKNSLRKPGPWKMTFGGFGECLPDPANFVEIDKERVEAWGFPWWRFTSEGAVTKKALCATIVIQAPGCLQRPGPVTIRPFHL